MLIPAIIIQKQVTRSEFNKLLDDHEQSFDSRIYLYERFWFVHLTVLILAIISIILNLKQIFDMVPILSQAKYNSVMRIKKKSMTIFIQEVSQNFCLLIKAQLSKEDQEEEENFLSPAEWWSKEFDVRGERKLGKIMENQTPWDELSFDEKMVFFDLWGVVAILGNAFQIASCVSLIIKGFNFTFETMQLLIGISCCLAWTSALRFIEFKQNIYLITFLLKYSLPSILKFMVQIKILLNLQIGVLPLFIGYSILGMCLFQNVSYFQSFDRASVGLICMMYGNQIYETAYYAGNNLISMVYVLTFSIAFQMAILNIFMTIFVSIVYDKFDAQIKQETVDYFQKYIPNLAYIIQHQKIQTKRDLDQIGPKTGQIQPSNKNIIYSQSPNITAVKGSPQMRFMTPLLTPSQSFRDQQIYRIKNLTKVLIKYTKKLVDDVNEDLRLLVKDKAQQQYVQTKKIECLHYLLKKSLQLKLKVDELKMKQNKVNQLK